MEVELSEKIALRMSQKEKERERRRMRDRQRRQSMSVEEREHHLARRRRNYQRRRQKADGSVFQQLEEDETADQQEGLLINNTLLISEADEQVVHESKPDVCLKIPSNISAMLPTRPRLTHVKHLARTFNDQAIVKHRVKSEVILKNGVSNCISAKTLRLNCIKRLARGLNHAVIESAEQTQQSEEGVQSLQCEESQQRISDMCQVVNINDDEGRNHQVTSDGNNELS